MDNKKMVWAGWIICTLCIAFLLVDALMKVVKAEPAVQGTVQIGYPESSVFWMGLALLVSTVLYAIPQTSILGAILVTGYLGGAVASNVRVGAPLFSSVLLPVYVGVLVWGGLYLRDERVRAMVPVRR
jgi:hypothetical protein